MTDETNTIAIGTIHYAREDDDPNASLLPPDDEDDENQPAGNININAQSTQQGVLGTHGVEVSNDALPVAVMPTPVSGPQMEFNPGPSLDDPSPSLSSSADPTAEHDHDDINNDDTTTTGSIAISNFSAEVAASAAAVAASLNQHNHDHLLLSSEIAQIAERANQNSSSSHQPNPQHHSQIPGLGDQSHEQHLASRRQKDRDRYASMSLDQREAYNRKRREQYHRQSEESRRKRRERERKRYHSLENDDAKDRNSRRASMERERYKKLSSSDLSLRNARRRERAAVLRAQKKLAQQQQQQGMVNVNAMDVNANMNVNVQHLQEQQLQPPPQQPGVTDVNMNMNAPSVGVVGPEIAMEMVRVYDGGGVHLNHHHELAPYPNNVVGGGSETDINGNVVGMGGGSGGVEQETTSSFLDISSAVNANTNIITKLEEHDDTVAV
jgi:hypothetical protein